MLLFFISVIAFICLALISNLFYVDPKAVFHFCLHYFIYRYSDITDLLYFAFTLMSYFTFTIASCFTFILAPCFTFTLGLLA